LGQKLGMTKKELAQRAAELRRNNEAPNPVWRKKRRRRNSKLAR